MIFKFLHTKKIILLLIMITLLSSNITASNYIHIELNNPYTGYVEANETNSHRVFIEGTNQYEFFSLKITVTPDKNSQADIKIEYWSSQHKELIDSSDKKNYSKPENIYIPIGTTGELFFDVYAVNDVSTNYTLLVERTYYDFTQTILSIVLIIGLYVCFITLLKYYDTIYYKISSWRFRRWYKKETGEEYDLNDINIYAPESQKVGISYENDVNKEKAPVYEINIERKNNIRTVLKWILGIITLIASIITIYGFINMYLF